MSRIPKTFSCIQSLRERYYKALPGKESLIVAIGEAEISEHVYNSNAIENSTLSLEETEKILLQIELERYVSEREIFEAKNLARLMTYIDQKAKGEEISLPLILRLHKMLIANIRDDIAGRFRVGDEWVRVGSYIAPAPQDVEKLLTEMLATYLASSHEHVITRIARLHLSFEHIHPFVDGNGRIGRALNNYALIRLGYVPINIAFVNRTDYYEAFKIFDVKGDKSGMEEIIGRALTNSYYKRLAYMEGKSIVTLKEYAKFTKESHSNVINKAKRQTIEAFLEKGEWKIGITR